MEAGDQAGRHQGTIIRVIHGHHRPLSLHFKYRLRALILALALGCCATAFAAVRHVHLPYPGGKVDVYTEAAQCVIVIEGQLDRGSAQSVSSAFRLLRPSECAERVVVFNSAGGTPNIAYSYAELIRKNGFDTEVARQGLCASACTYAFLGGERRFIDEKARFGVHQHTRNGICSPALTDDEDRRLRSIAEPVMPAPAIDRFIGLIASIDCREMAFLAPEILDELSIVNARLTRVSAAIRSAMETRAMQEIAAVRATARGPWVRGGGGAALTVFTRNAAGPPADSRPAIWGLVNHAEDRTHPQAGERYRSYEALHEVDCENQAITVILGVYAREAMGQGRIVWRTGRLPPTPVKPNTPSAIYFRLACGTAVTT